MCHDKVVTPMTCAALDRRKVGANERLTNLEPDRSPDHTLPGKPDPDGAGTLVRKRNRVTVHYLLADRFEKLGIFR